MKHPCLRPTACLAFLGAWLGLVAVPAQAITLGAADTFQSGTAEGWFSGGNNPTPPDVVLGGGPGGATDNYLRVTSSGANGAGGKLVVFAGTQWNGNYVAAGVTGMAMDLLNMGTTPLSLRLYLDASNASVAISAAGITLPANGAWTHVVFPLLPASLDGPGASVLADVTHLRLFHATAAAYPGAPIAANLGVDNITAVPEPASAWMAFAGLAGLGLRHHLRHGAARPPT